MPDSIIKPMDEFSLSRLENYIWQCADNPIDMPLDAFCGLLDEVVRFLGTFGKAMFIAVNDVQTRSRDIRKNRDFLANQLNKPANMSLQ